jgi:hypothetical protein
VEIDPPPATIPRLPPATVVPAKKKKGGSCSGGDDDKASSVSRPFLAAVHWPKTIRRAVRGEREAHGWFNFGRHSAVWVSDGGDAGVLIEFGRFQHRGDGAFFVKSGARHMPMTFDEFSEEYPERVELPIGHRTGLAELWSEVGREGGWEKKDYRVWHRDCHSFVRACAEALARPPTAKQYQPQFGSLPALSGNTSRGLLEEGKAVMKAKKKYYKVSKTLWQDGIMTVSLVNYFEATVEELSHQMPDFVFINGAIGFEDPIDYSIEMSVKDYMNKIDSSCGGMRWEIFGNIDFRDWKFGWGFKGAGTLYEGTHGMGGTVKVDVVVSCIEISPGALGYSIKETFTREWDLPIAGKKNETHGKLASKTSFEVKTAIRGIGFPPAYGFAYQIAQAPYLAYNLGVPQQPGWAKGTLLTIAAVLGIAAVGWTFGAAALAISPLVMQWIEGGMSFAY